MENLFKSLAIGLVIGIIFLLFLPSQNTFLIAICLILISVYFIIPPVYYYLINKNLVYQFKTDFEEVSLHYTRYGSQCEFNCSLHDLEIQTTRSWRMAITFNHVSLKLRSGQERFLISTLYGWTYKDMLLVFDAVQKEKLKPEQKHLLYVLRKRNDKESKG
ncbi:MAG: hypothetical protein GC181_11360 [Bacteroidetes bacterium]|nr:hypothetical protein [Bacteroidota bacterium]